MQHLTRRSLASLWALPAVLAGRAEAQSDSDTSIDGDGAVEIRRKVPVPTTVSQPAQALLASGRQFAPDGWTKESAELVEKMRGVYPVKIEAATVAGVKVKVVTSLKPKAARNDRVLINLHGGGFTSDSGSLLESIPIASLTGTKVIAVEYRLAPAFPYPAAVDDSVAVYREILKTHPARNIAVYGTSAGAILTAQTAVHLRKLGVPLPSSLGFFSGSADFARSGDSRYIYSVRGFLGFKPPAGTLTSAYVAAHDPKDPLLSPIYADLKGLPPTLCMTGTRDMLLSGTCDFHRALLRAGVDAHLMVFDAMPHAHWYSFQLPESKEALEAQATFLDRHLA